MVADLRNPEMVIKMITDWKHIDFTETHPKLEVAPLAAAVQSEESEEEWLEYDTMFEENKTIFNYKIKKHRDQQDEYKSKCIKVTEMLW